MWYSKTTTKVQTASVQLTCVQTAHRTRLGSLHFIFCERFDMFSTPFLASRHTIKFVDLFTTTATKILISFVPTLAFSSHHLEYGFPSTHSTNTISIALYVFAHMYDLRAKAAIGPTAFGFGVTGLIIYAFSIVYGRIYTGMHSFTDCFVGVILGAGSWLLQHLLMDKVMNTWLANESWIGDLTQTLARTYTQLTFLLVPPVPFTIIVVCLLMVNQHPQPVDNCPCFEDAIAFVSVGMGSLVGRWYAFGNGYDHSFYVSKTPGSSYDTWAAVSVWWVFAVVKVTFGKLLISPNIYAMLNCNLFPLDEQVSRSSSHGVLSPKHSYTLCSLLFTVSSRA
jgi:membrane-associated phospholipid phosphatase